MVEAVTPLHPSRISAAEMEARISRGSPSTTVGSTGFAETLEQAADQLSFSSHAQARLKSRDIHLTAADQADLARAVDIAGQKGAQESLILLDDLALIVSVRNRVVITAMERDSTEPSVFTHIDSAIMLTRSRE
jgi:flagellar operon protein